MGATHFNIADFSPLRFADELLLASVAPDRQPFAPCSLRLRGVCIHNFVAEQWTQLPFLGFSRMRSGLGILLFATCCRSLRNCPQ